MINDLVAWIREKVEVARAKGCVFGLSGGVDSSVIAALCKKAFPNNSLGIIMPCFSLMDDAKYAQQVAQKLALETKVVDLGEACNNIYQQLEGKPYDGQEMSLAIANLKPRLRMLTLYYYANKLNYLVVGTGNKSEAMMGYCTKHGDAAVDILPLANVLKSQVTDLAKKLLIPEEIISKPPSAGLWAGQTDEAEMGISYEELDKIIIGLETNNLMELDPKLVNKVKQRILDTEHKRSAPPAFKL